MEFKVGFYLSEHPTKLHKSLLKQKKYSDISELYDSNSNNKISKPSIKANNWFDIRENERNSKTGKSFVF